MDTEQMDCSTWGDPMSDAKKSLLESFKSELGANQATGSEKKKKGKKKGKKVSKFIKENKALAKRLKKVEHEYAKSKVARAVFKERAHHAEELCEERCKRVAAEAQRDCAMYVLEKLSAYVRVDATRELSSPVFGNVDKKLSLPPFINEELKNERKDYSCKRKC